MTSAQRQLLETLTGHLSLLKANQPRKASSATAKACKQYIKAKLRETGSSLTPRKAA